VAVESTARDKRTALGLFVITCLVSLAAVIYVRLPSPWGVGLNAMIPALGLHFVGDAYGWRGRWLALLAYVFFMLVVVSVYLFFWGPRGH
jgi:hypothetical protein